MTLAVTSAPFQSVNMPALDLRRFLSAGLQEGVMSSTAMAVAQRAAGANMSVDIAAGEAAVAGESITNQGLYYAYNDATFNLTGFTAANATLPRIDRVALRVRDAFHGDAASDLAFVIVTGTATAGATLANLNGVTAVPAGHLLLANVLIPATATTVTSTNIDTTYISIRPSATAGSVFSTTSAWSGGPPGSPVDNQIWYAESVDSLGTQWTFRYNAGSASSFKWEFAGGPFMRASVATSESTSGTTFGDLTTVGPSLALVRAGDWQIWWGALAQTTVNGSDSSMGYALSGGTTLAANNPVVYAYVPGGQHNTAGMMTDLKTGIAAATTATAKYKTSTAGTASFQNRWISAQPLRIA